MVDGIYFGYSGIKLERGCECMVPTGTHCLCELAGVCDMLWLVLRAFVLTLVFQWLHLVAKCCKWIFATFDGILCLDNRYCLFNNSYLVLCSYHTYLQWFWLHIREEPVFFGKQRFPVSISEDAMQFCEVCEEM